MQPVPNVTEADVERVVRREFRVSDVPTASAILNASGHHPRIRLAVLKLARGDIEALQRHLLYDPRDALSAAEYPMASSVARPLHELPPAERQAIYDADWKQYNDWLHRSGAA